MNFASPHMFHWLWFVLVMAGLLLLFWRRRKRILARLADQQLLNQIMPQVSQRKVFFKGALVLCVLLFSVLALVRPQWGFQWQEVKRQGLDIILAIDVSKSMLAEDVKPNRLDRVKLAVRDLLKKLKGDRIGLIAFSGQAFLVSPLTVDYNGFLLSLDDMGPQTIPRGGTNVGEAIEEAIKGYEDIAAKHKAVIIVTDGENLEGKPLEWAKRAREDGIKIYTVGVGTADGDLIQLRNAQGQLEYLKDENGNIVKSRLNERLLQQIARETEGAYVRAGGAYFGLDVIYDQELSKLEKREIESKMEKKFYDRFQIPLFIALLFLVVETVITNRKNT